MPNSNHFFVSLRSSTDLFINSSHIQYIYCSITFMGNIWLKSRLPLSPLCVQLVEHSTGNAEAISIKSRLSPIVSLPFLFTGSVDIQASTAMVMPTTSRVPFVLHLPANCQHNCVNTWGSYYCTCRQGYKLQADRTTCVGKWLMPTAHEINNADNKRIMFSREQTREKGVNMDEIK